MTSILKDSDIKEFDELIIEDLTITGDISNSSILELKAPTVVIDGGTGDTKLQIKADSDNSGETDNPIIELIQDGDGINSTIGIGTLSGETNGNALIFSNAVPDASQFVATGGIMFKTGRTGDVSTSSERFLIDPDGEVKVLSNLDVAGNITLGDDDFIKFGAGNDLQIGHDPDRNFINHSKQIQFKSTMSSGDSYKFLETGQRESIFLFSSNNNAGSEKSNYYFTFGNDNTDATDRSFMLERIRKQDGTGLHTIIEKSQVGNTVDTAVVDTLCIAKFSNDVHIADGKSIYLGDSNDLRITHNGTDSFIQDANQGNLHIRTNGTFIGISDTTSSTNFMGKFIKDGAVELYHNKVLRMSTTVGGVLIGDAFSHNDTNIAFTTTTAQFVLGGTHNSGQPSGSPTVKLLLTGTDNDDNPPVDYHTVFVDENGNIDFSVKAGYEASNLNIPEFFFRGQQLNTFNGGINASGAGFSDAIVKSNIRKIDNEIITTICFDLDEGPMKSQESGKIIGKSSSTDTCQLTQLTAIKNGYIYKAELSCIEIPDPGSANIDLVFSSSAQAPGSTTFTVLIDSGVFNRGKCVQVLLDNVDIDNKFLHIACGSTDGTQDYTSGKFILKLYGANF